MWTGEAGSYDLGSFTCTPGSSGLPWHETCVHTAAMAAAGRVTVGFDVVSNVD